MVEYMDASRNDRESDAALERLTELVNGCRLGASPEIPVKRIYAAARVWAKGGAGFRMHPERVVPEESYRDCDKWTTETILEWLSDVPLIVRRFGLLAHSGSPGARAIVKNLCAELCRRERDGLLQPAGV